MILLVIKVIRWIELSGGVMGVEGKIDVLDFLINILREHERTLDGLLERLETVSQELEYWITRERYDSVSIRTQEILGELLGEPIPDSRG